MSASFAPPPRFPPSAQLSVVDTARLHATWALKGVVDGSRWPVVASGVVEDAELRANVIQSTVLNVITLISVHAFGHVMKAADEHGRLHESAIDIYNLFWTLPLISISLYFNAIFCARSAKRVFTLVHGSRSYVDSVPTTGPLLSRIAVLAPRWIMLFISFAVDWALRYIPVVGSTLAFIFLSWVDAYYFFEFAWTGRGIPLGQRVQHLEERWAYYLGFGFPSAVLLTIASSTPLSNVTLFALIYPSHIILATHARPLPADPHDLTPFSSSEMPSTPSPFLPIRLPILTPVLVLDRLVLSILSGLDTRTGGKAGIAEVHHARSSDGPRAGFTRVVRNQVNTGDGSSAGRRTFTAGPYGGNNVDAMESGESDVGGGWTDSRKFS